MQCLKVVRRLLKSHIKYHYSQKCDVQDVNIKIFASKYASGFHNEIILGHAIFNEYRKTRVALIKLKILA